MKHDFSALVKCVGRISKKTIQLRSSQLRLEYARLMENKSQNLSQKMGGPPITVQPVTHSILTAEQIFFLECEADTSIF